MAGTPHFDAEGLLAAVAQQPVGLCVSTNHPSGFRRLLYLASRKNPALKVQILQSPDSANAFYLLPASVDVNAVAVEHQEQA